ncbi:MAG: Bifunctional PGK/TIM [Chlamydiae bacterium]|nr:Bifunctional PGK/TIM [Chlamydiota bacterium]
MSKEVRIVANWKMNKTIEEATDFISKLPEDIKVVSIAVPSTALYTCAQMKPPMLSLGAQNIHSETHGPFTGEISADMVKDAGAEFVILGHSERRHTFNETNEFVNKKVKQALLTDLQVILCIGETHTERDAEQTTEVLKKQLFEGLFELNMEQLKQVSIAYEPVWAIGTGQAATAQMAQETHFILRNLIKEKWGELASEKMFILHGGSIKPENIAELTSQPDVDGVLVGGAALDPSTFSQIIQNAGNAKK